MSWKKKSKSISGNLVIDGTLESKHIKTNSIEANKFTGATQEQYFYKFDDITVPFSTYTTLHEFDMPPTELDLIKGREIQFDWDFTIYTGTSATVGNSVYVYIEVEVPENEPSFRGIGNATHVSFPESGWQRMEFVGNYLNRFGFGQVGAINTYKAYRNLTYDNNVEINNERVINGLFNSLAFWTVYNGSAGIYAGAAIAISQDDDADLAYFSQALTVEAGTTYRLKATYNSASTAGGSVILSTSNDPSDAFYTKNFATGSTQYLDTLVKVEHSTIYIIGRNNSTTENQFVVFDDFSLKPTEGRTYVDVSTSGGAFSTTQVTEMYHHPFGNASSGYALVKQKIKSIRTNSYTTYCNITASAYLGIAKIPLKCRVRARHFYYGDTVTTTDGAIRVISRMTGEQHES